MFNLKGFVTHAALTSNVKGVVSPIGEMSTQALTYAREKGLYKAAAAQDMSLTTFLTVRDGVHEALPQEVVDHVMLVTKFIYTRVIAGGEIYADELLVDLIHQFPAATSDYKSGAIINDGTFWCPEWVSWKSTAISSLGTQNEIKIWFCDESFKSQYDDYEIVVIPPLVNLNDFFKTSFQVRTAIQLATQADTMNRIQEAKEGYPESIIRADLFDYVDPLNSTNKISTVWNLLIYGQNGNNIDAISDKLVEYILANSTHTRAEWMVIFPDIFKRTEFIMVPSWEQYAIPNRTLESGIYSPVYNINKAREDILLIATEYPSAHVEQYCAVMGHVYKSMTILSIGSPDNRDSKFALVDVFPDYIAVPSTSNDFNRMGQDTQNWSLMIAAMLIVAETVAEFTNVPLGMTKVKRGGILYLVKRFKNINYLIAAKSNFPLV